MTATVIITGGGGFLGQCLATAILKQGTLGGRVVSKIVLADIRFPPTLQPAIEADSSVVIKKLQGDISQPAFCDQIYAEISQHNNNNDAVSIFHLGAVMSGDGERDFDLCMNVNLYGFLHMIEGARQLSSSSSGGRIPTFIFCSAGATIGAGAPTDYITHHDTISDASRATPHTTYGATKACCELLLTDYARRGFVDARGVRLPTIAVRAGAPNAATTSCFSSVLREPLAGIDVVLPIAAHVPHAVTGTRAAVRAMIVVHDAPVTTIETVLGFDRTVFLPATAVSLGELQTALYKVVASREALGSISYTVDERLSEVVGSFPTKIDADRAIRLGVPAPPTAEELVREYIADFPSAIAEGIQIVPESSTADAPVQADKVAVITGGGSGIGRAVAERLSKGGWAVVLAGRRLSALLETQELLDGKQLSLCVPTDVTSEKEVDSLFVKAVATYGHVDLLFNNAGVNSKAASIEQVSVQDFTKVLTTNVTGPFLCARAAMQAMATTGGGRIINNGSISAHVPRPGSACYTTSKHALLGLTKCIALDGRSLKVACGQVDFGNVVTALSLDTNKVGTGAMQANGTTMVEPSMNIADAAETVWTMANLPLEANVLQMTVMATSMPFVGRG